MKVKAIASSFVWFVTGASAFSSSPQSRIATSMSAAASETSDAARAAGRHIVVVGGGIQGTSCAFQLRRSPALPPGSTVTVLEATALAAAASGKGGGFMARSWGDGTSTQQLHELAFDMYPGLCEEIGVESYRTLPVMSVSPGPNNSKKQDNKKKNPGVADIIPAWLDGSVGRLSPMGWGDDTAQVTPKEFVTKMMEHVNRPGQEPGIEVVLGSCTGIEAEDGDGVRVVTGVTYRNEAGEERTLPCDAVVVAAGPWACQAEEWFKGAVQLPMEGVKSTSIVWKPPVDGDGNPKVGAVDATALFCGEDDRFGTHLEVYPRPDGTIYICGIGGSDYVTTPELQAAAFISSCPPKPDRVEAASQAFRLMSNSYAQEGELSHAQACMRPCPPDAKPYMGRVPGWAGAYVNAGHNCWGIAWAPACGKALAELVLEGRCRSLDLGPFDPARFTAARGRSGRGRKKGGVDVGEQW